MIGAQVFCLVISVASFALAIKLQMDSGGYSDRKRKMLYDRPCTKS